MEAGDLIELGSLNIYLFWNKLENYSMNEKTPKVKTISWTKKFE
jgi:hypothetical protein